MRIISLVLIIHILFHFQNERNILSINWINSFYLFAYNMVGLAIKKILTIL